MTDMSEFWARVDKVSLAMQAATDPRERARLGRELDRLANEYHQCAPVACWSWPVTTEHQQRAGEARACPDPAQAYQLAWTLLTDWQAGRCGICGGNSDRFLDHSHKTGLVRGWLCQSCNLSEGFDGSPDGRAARYRTKNPASILGIEMRYYSPFTGWAEPEPEREAEHDRSPGYLLATYLADGDGG